MIEIKLTGGPLSNLSSSVLPSGMELTNGVVSGQLSADSNAVITIISTENGTTTYKAFAIKDQKPEDKPEDKPVEDTTWSRSQSYYGYGSPTINSYNNFSFPSNPGAVIAHSTGTFENLQYMEVTFVGQTPNPTYFGFGDANTVYGQEIRFGSPYYNGLVFGDLLTRTSAAVFGHDGRQIQHGDTICFLRVNDDLFVTINGNWTGFGIDFTASTKAMDLTTNNLDMYGNSITIQIRSEKGDYLYAANLPTTIGTITDMSGNNL